MDNKKNKMSVLQLTMITAINMMGSGIIMLPANLARVGTMSILSWLITGIGSMALAYAFAQSGMFSRNSGGMGGYAEYSHGKSGSFMANYSYGSSLIIANVAIAISAVGYASVLFGVKLSPISVGLCTIFTLWLATALNFGGARITGKISSFTVWGVIIPVLAMSTLGWFWFSGHLYATSWNPNKLPFFSAVGKSISITLWAFLGLESASANMDAVDNPKKNVPIACLGGTIGAAIIYIVSTNVIAGIVPNADLLNTNAPFGLAFSSMLGPVAGKIVMAMMIMSCFGSLLGWQFTIAGVFKSSAVEGYFPKIFGKVTKTGTPIWGMVVITAVQSLLALMTINPSLSGQFNVLVNLAVVTNVIPYLLSMASVNVILKSEKVPAKQIKRTTFVALIASIYSLYALYSSGLEPMFYGSIVTFAGWTLYGFVSHRFDVKKEVEVEKLVA
jgi:putrescine:ornithine antiporter